MRRLFALLFYSILFLNSLRAGCGIYEYYLNILSPTSTWYGTNNAPLNGALLANNIIINSSTLNIETRGINTWNDNGSDVTSARFNYRVYKQGTSAPSFNVVNLTYQSQNGNNKFWNNNNPQINLLQGLTTTGTYVFEVYFDATSNCQSGCACTIYQNNGGSNFIATFIVTGTLPIDLLFFDALIADNNRVRLSWESNSIANIEMFEIQHSSDGKNFSTIEIIKVSSETRFESFHKNPSAGFSYYRLKQTDRNGQISYSAIRSVDLMEDQIKISPNPTSTTLSIHGLNKNGQVISIFDQNGKELNQTLVNSNFYSLDVEGLKPGIYFIRIMSNTEARTFRFIKS